MRIGAQCPETEMVFKEYHSRVREAINTFSNSLLIDLHGMKYERITQIGYGVENNRLCDGSHVMTNSTIKKLASKSIEDLIIGPNSFSSFMSRCGILSTPSALFPHPGLFYF